MGTDTIKTRYDHIDIAKGIGILLVIALHSNFHLEIGTTFEMPLFFLLAGIFIKPQTGGVEFLRKKVNSLLIPCFLYYLPVIIYNTYFYLCHKDVSIIQCFENSAIPTALWFLISLFEIHIIGFFILKIKNPHFQILISILLSIIGYAMSVFHIPSLAYINTSLSCFIYYYAGFRWTEYIKSNQQKISVQATLSALFLAICFFVYHITQPYIFYRNNVFNASYFSVFVCGFSGTFFIISISKMIKKNFILSFYGKNSLIILCTHLYIIKILQHFHLAPLLLFLLTSIIMIPASSLIRKYLPILSGNKTII